MAVRADRRRRGIGHALMSSVEEVLASEGRRTLVALTVSPSDPGGEPPDALRDASWLNLPAHPIGMACQSISSG
jgi:GNAT superfamily N-acetyltransferase